MAMSARQISEYVDHRITALCGRMDGAVLVPIAEVFRCLVKKIGDLEGAQAELQGQHDMLKKEVRLSR